MMTRSFNILLSSAGRRVALLEYFRNALKGLSIEGKVYAADIDPTAPTLQKADGAIIVPRVNSPEYVETLRNFCQSNRIRLVVPLIDPELEVLAQARDSFLEHEIRVMVSSAESMRIMRDKFLSADFFQSIGVPCPKTAQVAGFNTRDIVDSVGLPVILKPRYGSSGQGVVRCKTREELERALSDLNGPYVAQELVVGDEVTIDVFGTGDGQVLSMVPRKRLKVRGGEVERAITISDDLFREDVLRIAKALKPFGAINVQCIVSSDGPKYTEINGRFGGGYPLAHMAGARFPELLIQLVLGKSPEPLLGKYEAGLVMSRYDEAIFVRVEELPGSGGGLMDLPYVSNHAG